MKLKVKNGVLDINSVDLDKLKTEIKWVDVNKQYFLELEEKEGYLEPIGLYETPKGICVSVVFEIIYKSYALTDFGLGAFNKDKDFVDVEIKDYRFVLV
jgi:hypothetical protein